MTIAIIGISFISVVAFGIYFRPRELKNIIPLSVSFINAVLVLVVIAIVCKENDFTFPYIVNFFQLDCMQVQEDTHDEAALDSDMIFGVRDTVIQPNLPLTEPIRDHPSSLVILGNTIPLAVSADLCQEPEVQDNPLLEPTRHNSSFIQGVENAIPISANSNANIELPVLEPITVIKKFVSDFDQYPPMKALTHEHVLEPITESKDNLPAVENTFKSRE